MKLYKEFIPHIENALGFKLYEHQVNYLLGKGGLMGGRRTGKTVAHCIKLALSDGDPLDMRKPEEYADEWSLPDHTRYARSFFRNEFMKIRQQLKDYGFPVRDVIK